MTEIKKVVVLFDGTWCGRETNTMTNIAILSKMMGINLTSSGAAEVHRENVHAKYFDGVGLGGDFINYLWNGAFATKAKEECTAVYRFIAEYFEWNEKVNTEVWMFGISRGAYIVRSVGGMINNCGIVRCPEKESLLDQVYDIYRSPQPVNHPSSSEMQEFRRRVSHQVTTPIKFMGLFDTVGSRGVPNLNYHTGTGFEWPEFYNSCVSTAVEKVYHAVAIHDRLWAFQPCLAMRDPKHTDSEFSANLQIRQKWFPGCHYDLARQEFQFLREEGSLWERALSPVLNLFSYTVLPNLVLSDLVLLWMLQGIAEVEMGPAEEIALGQQAVLAPLVIKNAQGNLSDLYEIIADIRNHVAGADIGSGDIYENILSYIPGGKIFFTPLGLWRKLNRTAYDILFKTVDRVIPDPGIGNGATSPVWNQVYNYKENEAGYEGHSIESIAGIRNPRYRSRTYERYLTYVRAMGLTP